MPHSNGSMEKNSKHWRECGKAGILLDSLWGINNMLNDPDLEYYVLEDYLHEAQEWYKVNSSRNFFKNELPVLRVLLRKRTNPQHHISKSSPTLCKKNYILQPGGHLFHVRKIGSALEHQLM